MHKQAQDRAELHKEAEKEGEVPSSWRIGKGSQKWRKRAVSMPGEMWGKGFLTEKTAREGDQVGSRSEKEVTLGSQGTGAGICPNNNTLPSQDSRTPRGYLPSGPGMLQALDPYASLCPQASSAGAGC